MTSIRSQRGRARTILIVMLLTAAAAGAFYAGMYLRERQEPAGPAAAPPPGPPVPTRQAPPVETPKEEPAPAPGPRRRATRPAPKPEAPAPVEAPPATGTLHIDSDVPGASVFIDRQYIGTTPVTAKDIAPGSHHLNVSAAGHEGVANTIEVQPGERDIMVRFKEVRLDAALDVVHKHRLGSCRGRLVATPLGLRYETSDKDDVFAAPLTGLEIFEVDYLKKTLRIKPRGGKTYNFTDPDENADRLFVFHRDVDKARQKLAAR